MTEITDEQRQKALAHVRVQVSKVKSKYKSEYDARRIRMLAIYSTIRTALEPKTVDMDFIYRWSNSMRLRSRHGNQTPQDADALVKSLVKELGITVEEK